MAGSSKDVDAARTALERVRDDLERRLASEAAWAALKQLEGRLARGEASPGIDYDEIKARLCKRLDASVADWRTLDAIGAAIAALATNSAPADETRPGPPPLPEGGRAAATPPPLPDEPKLPQQPQRTRYGPTTSRPIAPNVASPPPPSARNLPQQMPRSPDQMALKASPASAQTGRSVSAGRRLASALGLAGDGPARLTALEAEIDRMMRREVGVWDRAGAAAPSSPAARPASVRVNPSAAPVPQKPEIADAAAIHGEEAEVEIVALAAGQPKDEARPITRLADRLNRVDAHPEEGGEPAIALHGPIEEASVEIVLLDEARPEPSGGSAEKGAPQT